MGYHLRMIDGLSLKKGEKGLEIAYTVTVIETAKGVSRALEVRHIKVRH